MAPLKGATLPWRNHPSQMLVNPAVPVAAVVVVVEPGGGPGAATTGCGGIDGLAGTVAGPAAEHPPITATAATADAHCATAYQRHRIARMADADMTPPDDALPDSSSRTSRLVLHSSSCSPNPLPTFFGGK